MSEFNFDVLFTNGQITLGSLSHAAGICPSLYCDIEDEVHKGRLRSLDDWETVQFYRDDGTPSWSRPRGGYYRGMRIAPKDLLAWIDEYPAQATKHLGADFMQVIIERLK